MSKRTFVIAESSVGFGAELLVPNNRFITVLHLCYFASGECREDSGTNSTGELYIALERYQRIRNILQNPWSRDLLTVQVALESIFDTINDACWKMKSVLK